MNKERSITLVWYAKTERGWRQFPALFTTEYGRKVVKHCHVMDRGEEQCYPEGRFQLRTFQGTKTVYRNVPESAQHPRDAVLFLERERRMHQANTNPEFKSGAGLIAHKVRAYILHLEGEGKHVAAKLTRIAMDDFMEHCPTQYVKALPSSPSCVTAFHNALKDAGNSPRTVVNKNDRLKAFLRWCKLPVDWMPSPPTVTKTTPDVYTAEQIEAIRKAVADSGDKVLGIAIELAGTLGLREQELLYAQWGDIDWKHKTFTVSDKPEWGFKPKDAEERQIPIPDETIDVLKCWRKQRPDTVLILDDGKGNNSKGKPRAKRTLLKKMKRVVHKAGIKEDHKGFTLHRWRRSYLTTLLRNDVDLRTVQHLAGHASITTTSRYLRPAEGKELQAKVGAIKW